MRLNILALSYLFPNRARPSYGVFVLNRIKALEGVCNIKVIAPVQWYPFINYIMRASSSRTEVPLREEIDGVEVHHPRFFVVPRYFKWIDALSYFLAVRPVVTFLQREESFEFDLVDVHWTYPDILAGYFLARKNRKKLIVTIRGREALYSGERTLRRWMLVHLLRRADFVVTLSDELRDLVLELGVAPERVRTILNGVDLSSFHIEDRAVSRRRLGLTGQRKIIVSVGALLEGKGHHELVRIMPGLLRTEEVEFYIVGGLVPGHDFSSAIREMIAALGLTNVHLVDKVEHSQLADWYNAADLFCLVSRSEGCPNVVLEALACGTPVVVTRVGAVEHFVVPGENGFLVRGDELGSLEETVRSALNREWNRTAIASTMSTRGWSSCAEQVADIYRLVLGLA